MPKRWIKLLSFLLIEKAKRLSFRHFVHYTFLGFCKDGREVTEEVEGFPGAWPVPLSSAGHFQAQSVAGSFMTQGLYYSMIIPSYATPACWMNRKNEVQEDDNQPAAGPAPHNQTRDAFMEDRMCGAIVTGLELKDAWGHGSTLNQGFHLI